MIMIFVRLAPFVYLIIFLQILLALIGIHVRWNKNMHKIFTKQRKIQEIINFHEIYNDYKSICRRDMEIQDQTQETW